MIRFKVENKPIKMEVKDESAVKMSVQPVSVVKINGSSVRIGVVTLLASAWVGENNLYSQVVSIDGVTDKDQVDLTPDVDQLLVFYEKDLTFVTENDNGVVTVYAIGQKPTHDYVIQVTLSEVVADGKIIGVTVGTPMSISQIKEKINPVTSVNGVTADEVGNVEIKAMSDEEVLKLQSTLV